MNKWQIINLYKQRYTVYKDEYLRIDSNIKPLVDWIRKHGFITFASCGSHIFDFKGKERWCAQAYVAFVSPDGNESNLEKLKNHKFPESKYFKIIISETLNPVFGTIYGLDILFNTRYNRINFLKRIYNSLGVSYPSNMKLEKERKPFWPYKENYFIDNNTGKVFTKPTHL